MIFEFRKNHFDVIRLLAALQVVIFHAHKHLNLIYPEKITLLLQMFPGVPIFFIISGYLISHAYSASKSLSIYSINRFLRIYPGLWVCFLISILSVMVFSNTEWNSNELIKWFFAQITFFQFYNPGFLREYGCGVLNGSLWTISVELQFYIFIPFFYFISNLFFRKNFNIFIISLIILSCILNVFYYNFIVEEKTFTSKIIGVTLFPYLYFFLIGTLIEKNLNIIKKFFMNKFLFWFIFYFFISFIINFFGDAPKGNYLNPIAAFSLAGVIISAAYSFSNLKHGVYKNYDLSYGIYIYHMIIINAFIQMGLENLTVFLIPLVLITMIFALMSWILIENKALSLKKQSIREKRNKQVVVLNGN